MKIGVATANSLELTSKMPGSVPTAGIMNLATGATSVPESEVRMYAVVMAAMLLNDIARSKTANVDLFE
jgi:Na+/H+-dicarboxylate symporter